MFEDESSAALCSRAAPEPHPRPPEDLPLLRGVGGVVASHRAHFVCPPPPLRKGRSSGGRPLPLTRGRGLRKEALLPGQASFPRKTRTPCGRPRLRIALFLAFGSAALLKPFDGGRLRGCAPPAPSSRQKPSLAISLWGKSLGQGRRAQALGPPSQSSVERKEIRNGCSSIFVKPRSDA